MIFVNDEHLSKARYPISVTEEGIVICVNDEHPEKTENSIIVTEEGIDVKNINEYKRKAREYTLNNNMK